MLPIDSNNYSVHLCGYLIAWETSSIKGWSNTVRLEDCGRGDMRLSGWQQYDLYEDWEGVLDTLAVHLGGVSFSDTTAKDERTEEVIMINNLLGKGTTSYYSGAYDKALSLYEAAINIKPDDHEAWNNKGIALYSLGRYEEALKAYDKAIEIKSDSQEIWSNKGVVLFVLGRYEETLKAYDKAIEIKPDYHEAWHKKGNVLRKLGREQEALKAFDKAIEIKPDYHETWRKDELLADLKEPGNIKKETGRKIRLKRAFDREQKEAQEGPTGPQGLLKILCASLEELKKPPPNSNSYYCRSC